MMWASPVYGKPSEPCFYVKLAEPVLCCVLCFGRAPFIVDSSYCVIIFSMRHVRVFSAARVCCGLQKPVSTSFANLYVEYTFRPFGDLRNERKRLAVRGVNGKDTIY
jgi:hypothetical protein